MITDLKKLILIREDLELCKKVFVAKKIEFNATNEELLSKIDKISNDMFDCEESIRTQALVEFKNTGEKKLDGGVGIRVLKKLDYDTSEAFSWAKNHSLALSLDKKAFEKIAKADNIDFVKITEESTATIPTIIKLVEKNEI